MKESFRGMQVATAPIEESHSAVTKPRSATRIKGIEGRPSKVYGNLLLYIALGLVPDILCSQCRSVL